MIVATLVGNNALVPWEFVKSILQLPPKYHYYGIGSSNIAANRNKIFNHAKKEGDDLLMIDSDMVFEPEDVRKIQDHLVSGKDIITGICSIGDTGKPAIYEEGYVLTTPKEGVHEIFACGAAFLGIHRRVLLEEPFEIINNETDRLGEDVSFCVRAREKGYKIWADSSIQIGHLRTRAYYCGGRD